MNGNPSPKPSDPKRASESAAAPAMPEAAPPADKSELDLEVEEIRLPERMKEGFVGQER